MTKKRVAPKDYKNPDTRALTSTTFLGKLAEAIGLKEGISPDQAKTKPASLSQKAVRQALKRMGVGGIAVGYISDKIIPALKKYHQSNVRKKLVSDKKEFNKMMASGMGMTSKPKPKIKVSNVGKNAPMGAGIKRISIKKGDTLSAIARNNNTTVLTLKKLNPNVKPREMKIGGSLKIPRTGGTR